MRTEMSFSDHLAATDATSSLLKASGVSIERLPMLQVLFERICDHASKQFQDLSDVTVEMFCETISTGTVGKVGILDDEHVIAKLDPVNGASPAYISMDRRALYLLLECMLGASGEEKEPAAGHGYTTLDLLFAKTITIRILTSLKHVFSEFIDVEMIFDMISDGEQFLEKVNSDVIFVIVGIKINIFESCGKLYMLLPQDVLAPMKSSLLNVSEQQASTPDPHWVTHFKTEIQQTTVDCRAVLDGGELTLGEIAQMKAGQVLKLDVKAVDRVKLDCNDQVLFWGVLGQADGRFNVKITEPASEEKAFMDAMVSREQAYP